ncbi:MAG: hypothetical protein QXZ70_04870 [Candidatus Bathyarchaeia archaeon]
MNEQTRSTNRCPKEAAAQLRNSIVSVATLPKTVHKGKDTADE